MSAYTPSSSTPAASSVSSAASALPTLDVHPLLSSSLELQPLNAAPTLPSPSPTEVKCEWLLTATGKKRARDSLSVAAAAASSSASSNNLNATQFTSVNKRVRFFHKSSIRQFDDDNLASTLENDLKAEGIELTGVALAAVREIQLQKAAAAAIALKQKQSLAQGRQAPIRGLKMMAAAAMAMEATTVAKASTLQAYRSLQDYQSYISLAQKGLIAPLPIGFHIDAAAALAAGSAAVAAAVESASRFEDVEKSMELS